MGFVYGLVIRFTSDFGGSVTTDIEVIVKFSPAALVTCAGPDFAVPVCGEPFSFKGCALDLVLALRGDGPLAFVSNEAESTCALYSTY